MNIQSLRSQTGAVLTFEYVVLIVVGGLSAIGLGLWLAGHFVDTTHGWLGTLISAAEGMYFDYNFNWCLASRADTAAVQQGPALQFVGLNDQIGCNPRPGTFFGFTPWTIITSQ